MAACGIVISIWGVIMLVMLGIFFSAKSAVLIEDVPFTEEDIRNDKNPPVTIYGLYNQVGINCFIAAAIYVAVGAVSLPADCCEGISPTISIVPTNVWAVLMPVSTVLSAMSLTLNLSSVVVCLMHGYFTTEICRGEDDTERADWFLLDSRAVRHVAIGLFCLGVSVYLAAMSIYMLLVFEVETGIASACVLASGILILLVIVIHSLVKAARTAQHYRGGEHTDTLYQNQHSGSTTAARQRELQDGDKPRRHHNNSQLHRHLSYPPPCTDPKQHHQHQYSPSHSPQSHGSDKEGYSSGGSGSRMHRTLSTESGLLQSPSKPWNGINNEMRSVLARKSGASSKDSTLV